ncbi:nitrate- and nitrite sensing domain-containing protein [Streptomyces sp. B-S-A8]|uniref:histidine kinase n=1 Tax=Streptomyces solicavernae TaxID=3043614 RepID=A0ABT6RP54_9ACTN|nr:nitrate- and nitrite sensing domain-containing protein [Streptomyces sp. B-S-A8]MDI3386182.1 nitrate- and nitrite sensing domain-containing protein [Streptomyces sp. B-S-A8]
MQGRFKREGSAAAEPELRGGTGPVPGNSSTPDAAGSDGGGRGKGTGVSSGGPAPASPKKPSSTGSRIALRNWRISTRLVSLLALPVVAATSLGAIRISDSIHEMEQLDRMKLLTDMTKQATELAAALQDERDKSAGPLAHGAKASDFAVRGARAKTDRARQSFIDNTSDIDDARGDRAIDSIRQNVVQISTQLRVLKDIRRNAYKEGLPTSQTVSSYNQLIEQLLGLSQDMALATSNPEMIQRTRTLAAFSAAKEYASIQRAVISAALPPNKTDFGKLSDNDRLYALSALRNEEAKLDSFQRSYEGTGGNAAELMKPLDDSNAVIKDANDYAARVLESASGLKNREKRSYPDWNDAATTKLRQMALIETTLLNDMEQEARNLRDESQREAIINGALILLVLGVSLVGAFVVARSMIRSLRRLQDTATKVAQDRLPDLVKQLSESDPQDVDTSVESVGVHSRDEIGQVATAFDDVHREAVRLAAEQALLRGNVNAMFTNLSRRSQGLIQRQLSLISELESREADPDQLSSLFKLDHLATRMRRNGENLLVLAGEEPGRRWTRPVPLVDVLRAAASEVEQYERIELAAVPTTEVAGRVVNDLVHLLAELLENATSFSSPQTKVKVTGHALPDGRVLIEIHDTGIGLSPEDLAAINERLASPPTVDVSVSRRMGLFVVGRLSQRHGIRIQLRPSDSGGTTALVMLPVDIAQGGKKVPGKAGAPAPSGGPAAAQAAAGVAAARRGGQGGAPAGRLGATPSRGQDGLTAGSGPRAALPSRGNGPGQGQGSGAGAPQGQSQSQSQSPGQGQNQGQGPGAGAGAGAGQPQGGAPRAPQGPGGLPTRPGAGEPQHRPVDPQDHPGVGDALNGGQRSDVFGGPRAGQPSGLADSGPVPPRPRGDQGQGRPEAGRPQLPPRGGPRAELPGGNPQPQTSSWGAKPELRPSVDAAREQHDSAPPVDSTAQLARFEPEDRQGPGSTAEFARPDFDAPHPDAVRPDAVRPDSVRPDSSRPDGTGPHSVPQQPGPDARGANGPGSTGQFGRPELPQGPLGGGARNGARDTGEHRPPHPPEQPQAPRRPEPQQPDALTGPVDLPPDDGRTPLYDTLETNWFHGQQQERQQQGQQGQQAQQGQQGHQASQGRAQNGGPQQNGGRPAAPGRRPEPQAAPPMPPAPPAAPGNGGPGNMAPGNGAPGNGGPGNWRQSPNDELGRQAERVKQPSAGGVTTSGLPRRVPRANLVAGTAQQQQQQQGGPQVSRAPNDVRGRLTNLRRGIQQGREAGTGQTGSFRGPSHQQER